MSESLPHRFYAAFAARDWRMLGTLYADDARFSDPAFPDLSADEARAMWRMLLSRAGPDFRVEYVVREDTPTRAAVRWTAHYTFSQTGRRVVNVIDATMDLRDGRIVRHVDRFDFPRWARQALGAPGLLLGWTGWMQRQVQAKARAGLRAFIDKTAKDPA